MLEPGQIFASRYRVRRCIAEGGMGAIFEAEHTATERRVALKLLFPHIVNVGNAREKFELEAKISARVNSPYIVEVLDAGLDDTTKSPFLVMELLEGQTLARRVAEQGPLDTDAGLRLLEQVAAGLDAAHGYREAGGTPKPIVHRDLKPENLFLARHHDGSIVAKILDFGIAKVLGDTSNISQEVRGTPLFMAFEQITAAPLSPQTDVWAFGLIAYHTLTGARYWRSSDRQGASVQALFAEILSLPLEAPSVRLREQNIGIELPAAFDAWLLRCIDRNPSQRFSSAGAAAEALARVFERAPRASSKPPSERAVVSDRTETFIGLNAPIPLASAGSVPAMTTTKQRRSFRASTLSSKPVPWVAGGAAAGALLLGAIVWLAAGDAEDSPAAGVELRPGARRPAHEESSRPGAAPPPANVLASDAVDDDAPIPRRVPSAAANDPSPSPHAFDGSEEKLATGSPPPSDVADPSHTVPGSRSELGSDPGLTIAPEPRLRALPQPRVRIALPEAPAAASPREPTRSREPTRRAPVRRAASAVSEPTPAPSPGPTPPSVVEDRPALPRPDDSRGGEEPASSLERSGDDPGAPAAERPAKAKKTRKQRPGSTEAYKMR